MNLFLFKKSHPHIHSPLVYMPLVYLKSGWSNFDLQVSFQERQK